MTYHAPTPMLSDEETAVSKTTGILALVKQTIWGDNNK